MPLRLFQRSSGAASLPVDVDETEPTAPAEDAPRVVAKRDLIRLLDKGVQLQENYVEALQKGLEAGRRFFEAFNDTRLELALEAFDEKTRYALYEVLFFLHVNEPRFAKHKYIAIRVEHSYGVAQKHYYEDSACLYLEGAPHGVQGIEALPRRFRKEFLQYVRKEFGKIPRDRDVEGFAPFVSISALGSVGTMAHKAGSSDLDLQIQYELEPFLIDYSDWDDRKVHKALQKFIQWRFRLLHRRHKAAGKAVEKTELREQAIAWTKQEFPTLFAYFYERTALGDRARHLADRTIRTSLQREMMSLIKRHQGMQQRENKQKEALLRQRLDMIQDYIQKKFPEAEVYLFGSDNLSLRLGREHGSTLVSKEASGSAYRLMLTYDVLLPGTQFTPCIPSHFILPQEFCNVPARYDLLMDAIRFQMVPLYRDIAPFLVNLGPAARLDLNYILAHGGAVYWEAFKAASGNLAKALLNLFRIEMLHHEKYLVMIIELVKHPHILKSFMQEEEVSAGEGWWSLREMERLEEEMPFLRADPWWMKYRALKIAFAFIPHIAYTERGKILRTIDLCYAMHLKIADFFKHLAAKKPLSTHRDRFLYQFYERCFPPDSDARVRLRLVNIGETQAVIEFENELKFLFSSALERIRLIQEQNEIPDDSNQAEFEIWFHYYQKNFEPPENVIRQSILRHLKIPRLRLQISLDSQFQLWTFRSLQQESGSQRDRNDEMFNYLPDSIDLMTCKSFLFGLAYCIHNAYYGYVNRGSLKEQKTRIEVDSSATQLPENIDRNYAFARPDVIVRLADQISEFFAYRSFNYLECLNERTYQELFFTLNLMSYGHLAILFRDNLNNWYLEEFMIDSFRERSAEYYEKSEKMLKDRDLHRTIRQFLRELGISVWDQQVKFTFWINPQSVHTQHSQDKFTTKELWLADTFRKTVFANS